MNVHWNLHSMKYTEIKFHKFYITVQKLCKWIRWNISQPIHTAPKDTGPLLCTQWLSGTASTLSVKLGVAWHSQISLFQFASHFTILPPQSNQYMYYKRQKWSNIALYKRAFHFIRWMRCKWHCQSYLRSRYTMLECPSLESVWRMKIEHYIPITRKLMPLLSIVAQSLNIWSPGN